MIQRDLILEDLTIQDHEKLIHCVQSTFPAPNGEIMAKVLDLYPEDYLSFTKFVCHKAVVDGLSIVAKDPETLEVIGFCINEDFVSAPTYSQMDISPKFSALIAILEELDEEYRCKKKPLLGQVFHAYMLGVNEAYQRKSVAKKLVMASIEKAKNEKYESIVAEATGVASQALVLDLGFDVICHRSYRTFSLNNDFPFVSVKHPQNCIFVERNLLAL